MALPDSDLVAMLATPSQREIDEARERAMKLREVLAAAKDAIAGKKSES